VTPTKNKRVKIAVATLIVNIITLVSLTLLTDQPILNIGGAIMVVSTPVYAYIFAETKRPSEDYDKEIEK
jgi:hypothetical protein